MSRETNTTPFRCRHMSRRCHPVYGRCLRGAAAIDGCSRHEDAGTRHRCSCRSRGRRVRESAGRVGRSCRRTCPGGKRRGRVLRPLPGHRRRHRPAGRRSGSGTAATTPAPSSPPAAGTGRPARRRHGRGQHRPCRIRRPAPTPPAPAPARQHQLPPASTSSRPASTSSRPHDNSPGSGTTQKTDGNPGRATATADPRVVTTSRTTATKEATAEARDKEKARRTAKTGPAGGPDVGLSLWRTAGTRKPPGYR